MKNLDNLKVNSATFDFDVEISESIKYELKKLTESFLDDVDDMLCSDYISLDISFDFEITESNLMELLEECINESSDVTYYSNAMKILSENDSSLRESLSIANDLGFSLDNLNSEVLASLLIENLLLDELNVFDIDGFCSSLCDYKCEVCELLQDYDINFTDFNNHDKSFTVLIREL